MKSTMSHNNEGDVESEDEPFVPPPTSWFENSGNSWRDPTGTIEIPSTNEVEFATCSSITKEHPGSITDGMHAATVDMESPVRSASTSSSSGAVPIPMHGTIASQYAQLQAVGNTHPSPSWKEISSQVLPAAARELLTSSWRRIYHSARLSYSKGRWHRKYSDMGSNMGGIHLGGSSNLPFAESQLPTFSSLTWVDRQLVREWRTYLPEDDTNYHNSETSELDDADNDFARARAFVPNPFPRPKWHKSDVCHQCHKPFGPTRLRHHCRTCGHSFCQPHSSLTHKLPHLGYDPEVPERVCDECKRALEEQNLAERVAWRLARCRDYSEGNLTPYFELGLDSASEVALRITKAAITMAKSIPLGAQATIAVETVDVLRKYGLHGIYGIMLRQEFLAAADLLRRALGINKTAWPLSVHELSAAIFYALAQHRAMRGLYPEREEIIHTLRAPSLRSQQQQQQHTSWTGSNAQHNIVRTTVPSVIDNFAQSALSFHNNPIIDQTDTYNPEATTLEHLNESFDPPVHDPRKTDPSSTGLMDQSMPTQGVGFTPVCDPVSDITLQSLIFYAPLALNFVYATKEVDMQLLAAQQGWRLLYAYMEQEYFSEKVADRPASAVFIHDESKIACLAIRGTATIHDVITDIRQIPVPFPDQEATDATSQNDDDWTNVFRGQGLALCGMAAASVNLFREHIDALSAFARQGYRIRITGHSLGGGVAAMVGMLIMRHFEQNKDLLREIQSGRNHNLDEAALLRVYAYGTPSCVDAKLADSVDSFVTTVVLHDDVFPRLTPTSCRGLLKHLLHIRETWVKTHIEEDLRAVGARAKTVWAPKFRHSFTLGSASSAINIKKYCKKQLQAGKKKLLSVKEKIPRQDSKGRGGIIEDKSAFADAQSHETDSNDWGERFFLPVSQPVTRQPDEVASCKPLDARDDAQVETQAQLLLEFMGGVDTQMEGLVIDGDEFFDSEDKLIESDGEGSVSSECFRDPMSPNTGPHEPLSISDSWSIEQHHDSSPQSSNSNDGKFEGVVGSPAVVLEEAPLPRMFVPGKVIHIFSHRGVYKAAYVPRTFRELRRISLAGNMLSDHTTKCYYEGLLEVQTARLAPETPPKWSAFDEDDTCCCCACRFTWASTFHSEAQEARDKHNCRSCGGLVCDPCAKNRVPIPSIGLTVPVRVCDRCYHDMGGHSVASSSLTSSFLAIDEDENHSRDDGSSPGRPTLSGPDTYIETKHDERPERKREKRSLIVDELASRMRSSALTSCS